MAMTSTPLDLNGSVEVAIRISIILNSIYPDAINEEKLGILDYYLLNSEDFPDGPSSIHPKIPGRESQLTIKPILFKDALFLLATKELIEIVYEDSGIKYKANKLTTAFVQKLMSPYAFKLARRTEWIKDTVSTQSIDYLKRLAKQSVTEFETEAKYEF